ncbi:MAG: DUF4198 domain-containing protein [Gammaproteobacteria bacterium]|nr:DUF4198 domain-containing protein [Gammaproteobacteria bacterium]
MKQSHFFIRLLIVSLVLLAGGSNAHDFWLEAQPFYPAPGKTVELSVHVGNDYVGDTLPNISNWYSEFSLLEGERKSDVEGELGRDPAGFFKPQQDGTYAVGYQSLFQYTEIDPDTFNKYLVEEGLDHALEFRRQHQEFHAQGKERYIRHAKALVQSGTEFNHDNSTTLFGYALELVPTQNPYRKALNDWLEVKLLYQGKAATDIQVVAFSKSSPDKAQVQRSNSSGEVRIRLDQTGPWLVKAVKIMRLQQDKADWESHWASLTFAVR